MAALAAVFLLSGLDGHFGLTSLKLARTGLVAWHQAAPLQSAAVFFLAGVAMTGLSLPVAGIMMLAAGAVFGLLWGTAIALAACAVGATLAFLAARFLFRDAVESRFGDRLVAINRGIEQDGALYLFMIRFAPVFPFFIVNPVVALTRIRTGTFFLATLAGMLVGTVIFVNAGTELGRIDSLADVLSPRVAASLALLGAFPLAARKAVAWLRRRRQAGRVERLSSTGSS
jgi:uncharacterized membrane protein YdjX (TVP38/TMEM64 family)